MPTYRQSKTFRECGVCDREILEGEMMMDFFRERGGDVVWVHEKCLKRAMENWLTKKAEKAAIEKKAKEVVQ